MDHLNCLVQSSKLSLLFHSIKSHFSVLQGSYVSASPMQTHHGGITRCTVLPFCRRKSLWIHRCTCHQHKDSFLWSWFMIFPHPPHLVRGNQFRVVGVCSAKFLASEFNTTYKENVDLFFLFLSKPSNTTSLTWTPAKGLWWLSTAVFVCVCVCVRVWAGSVLACVCMCVRSSCVPGCPSSIGLTLYTAFHKGARGWVQAGSVKEREWQHGFIYNQGG